MNWKISALVGFLCVLSCKGLPEQELQKETKTYVIEAAALKANFNSKGIKILDLSKKEVYQNEHIEGAMHLERKDITDSTYAYNGIMASKTQIEALFSKLGISTKDTLVLYDDIGLCEAARLWWILQNYNFENVQLLHGGLEAWKAVNGQVSNTIPTTVSSTFKLPEESSMQYYISKTEVSQALNDTVVLLDTRTRDEFLGHTQKKGATKAGRIPHSVNIDWAEAINYNTDKTFKPKATLETIYNTLNCKKNDLIIVYCHSGVRSAHTTFVLTQLLGYTNVKNYDGSWTEWSYDTTLPYEKDSKTLTTH